MIPLMDAWISAVAFVIAVAHSGGMPRNAYAATKPEGDSSYAERLGELVSQYRSSGRAAAGSGRCTQRPRARA